MRVSCEDVVTSKREGISKIRKGLAKRKEARGKEFHNRNSDFEGADSRPPGAETLVATQEQERLRIQSRDYRLGAGEKTACGLRARSDVRRTKRTESRRACLLPERQNAKRAGGRGRKKKEFLRSRRRLDAKGKTRNAGLPTKATPVGRSDRRRDASDGICAT